MNRITDKMLQIRVDYLNKITGSPAEYFIEAGNTATGHFLIDSAYGGVALERVTNTTGGVTDVFDSGHMPKRELFERLCAFIEGYELANNPDRY